MKNFLSCAILALLALLVVPCASALSYFQVDYCNNIVPLTQASGTVECFTQYWIIYDHGVDRIQVSINTVLGTMTRELTVNPNGSSGAIATFQIDWSLVIGPPQITEFYAEAGAQIRHVRREIIR